MSAICLTPRNAASCRSEEATALAQKGAGSRARGIGSFLFCGSEMNAVGVDDEAQARGETEKNKPQEHRTDKADGRAEQNGETVPLNQSQTNQHKAKRRKVVAKWNRQGRNQSKNNADDANKSLRLNGGDAR